MNPFPVADYSFPGKGKDPFLSRKGSFPFPKLLKPFPVAAFPKLLKPFPVATFPGKGKDLSTPNMGNKVNLLQPTDLNFSS